MKKKIYIKLTPLVHGTHNNLHLSGKVSIGVPGTRKHLLKFKVVVFFELGVAYFTNLIIDKDAALLFMYLEELRKDIHTEIFDMLEAQYDAALQDPQELLMYSMSKTPSLVIIRGHELDIEVEEPVEGAEGAGPLEESAKKLSYYRQCLGNVSQKLPY